MAFSDRLDAIDRAININAQKKESQGATKVIEDAKKILEFLKPEEGSSAPAGQ
jgi:hypothetical protein